MKQALAPQLVALTEGINISLDKPIMLVGRHQECDIQIPSRKISRRHCCIALINDHCVVRDLGSTNGIRINGIKVVEGNLQPDDELTIGNVRYQLKLADGEVEHTVKASHKNGVRPAPAAKPMDHNQSYDVPMPIPDDAAAFPILESQPKEAANDASAAAPKSYELDIPDEVNLVPLQPPNP